MQSSDVTKWIWMAPTNRRAVRKVGTDSQTRDSNVALPAFAVSAAGAQISKALPFRVESKCHFSLSDCDVASQASFSSSCLPPITRLRPKPKRHGG